MLGATRDFNLPTDQSAGFLGKQGACLKIMFRIEVYLGVKVGGTAAWMPVQHACFGAHF